MLTHPLTHSPSTTPHLPTHSLTHPPTTTPHRHAVRAEAVAASIEPTSTPPPSVLRTQEQVSSKATRNSRAHTNTTNDQNYVIVHNYVIVLLLYARLVLSPSPALRVSILIG